MPSRSGRILEKTFPNLGRRDKQEGPLEIRVVSSLTLDDEARYAATFLKMLAAVLDSVPTSYAIQVQLADGVVVQHGTTLAPPALEERPLEVPRVTRLLPLRR